MVDSRWVEEEDEVHARSGAQANLTLHGFCCHYVSMLTSQSKERENSVVVGDGCIAIDVGVVGVGMRMTETEGMQTKCGEEMERQGMAMANRRSRADAVADLDAPRGDSGLWSGTSPSLSNSRLPQIGTNHSSSGSPWVNPAMDSTNHTRLIFAKPGSGRPSSHSAGSSAAVASGAGSAAAR